MSKRRIKKVAGMSSRTKQALSVVVMAVIVSVCFKFYQNAHFANESQPFKDAFLMTWLDVVIGSFICSFFGIPFVLNEGNRYG